MVLSPRAQFLDQLSASHDTVPYCRRVDSGACSTAWESIGREDRKTVMRGTRWAPRARQKLVAHTWPFTARWLMMIGAVSSATARGGVGSPRASPLNTNAIRITFTITTGPKSIPTITAGPSLADGLAVFGLGLREPLPRLEALRLLVRVPPMPMLLPPPVASGLGRWRLVRLVVGVNVSVVVAEGVLHVVPIVAGA